jgi:hypothetical protein
MNAKLKPSPFTPSRKGLVYLIAPFRRAWVLMAFDIRGIHRKTWNYETRLEATVARRRLLKSEGGLA